MVALAASCFALALPMGARAATQLVSIVDPKTTSRARVVSGSLLVADQSDPAQTAFTADVVVTLNPGSNFSCKFLATVPSLKRLVIETVSATARVPSGQHIQSLDVRVHVPTGDAPFNLLPTLAASTQNGDFYNATQVMEVYAEQKSSPSVCFFRPSTAGSASAAFAISGHFATL